MKSNPEGPAFSPSSRLPNRPGVDFIVTLDKPRVLRMNDQAADRFRALTGQSFGAITYKTSDLTERIRILLFLLFVLAEQTDPAVRLEDIASSITPDLLPKIEAGLNNAFLRRPWGAGCN